MKIWLPLLIWYGLATFRLAMLLSVDSGPAKVFQRMRSWLKREERKNPVLKKSDLAHGVECLRCSSVWVAAPIAAYAYYHNRIVDWVVVPGDIFLSAMALSSIAILLNRIPKR